MQVLRCVTVVMAGTAAIATASAAAYLMTSYGDVTRSYVINMAAKMADFAARRVNGTVPNALHP